MPSDGRKEFRSIFPHSLPRRRSAYTGYVWNFPRRNGLRGPTAANVYL
ncbi:cold-shock protein [Escherichia coli]